MLRKATAIFSILMGASMISMWTMFYLTGGIPELETEPARIILHMIAEFVTAIGLIIGGYGLITIKDWGYDVYLLATGALIYTLIQSPGYYLQQGVFGFVVMFATFILLTIGFLIVNMRQKKEYLHKA